MVRNRLIQNKYCFIKILSAYVVAVVLTAMAHSPVEQVVCAVAFHCLAVLFFWSYARMQVTVIEIKENVKEVARFRWSQGRWQLYASDVEPSKQPHAPQRP